MNTLEIQKALKASGIDPGPIDGKPGPKTTGAVKAFQERSGLKVDGIVGPVTETALKAFLQPDTPSTGAPSTLVPAAWMPHVKMDGIVFHWSAGGYTASELDKSHYHIIIEGSGNLVRGVNIAKNAAPRQKDYAAHTKNHNTGIIGVSLACMAGAKEAPFSAGTAPMKQVQLDRLPIVLADLCRFYGIPITRQTVLSHAEVQGTLGIKQAGKIDIMWVPGMTKMGDPYKIGDEIRAAVQKML